MLSDEQIEAIGRIAMNCGPGPAGFDFARAIEQACGSPIALRDYFAAKAMAALIECAENHGDIPHKLAAVDAYRYADAMMKARLPPPPGQ